MKNLMKVQIMASYIRQVWDFAPGPIAWKTPATTGPALPLPSYWDKYQRPALTTQAAYHPNRDLSAAVRKAYDASIAQHNKVASENYVALRAGFIGNWVTRNKQVQY